MVRVARITQFVSWLILTSSYCCKCSNSRRDGFDLADLEPSGFGYELLISKIELLEQKIVNLETLVDDLKVKQEAATVEMHSLRTSCTFKGHNESDNSSEETAETFKSCSDAPVRVPGLVQLKPPGGGKSFAALCDFHNHGGGWTIIQNRFSGEVDFYRTWEEYKNGFGDLKGEFWLGLDNVHRLTNAGNFELMFILIDRELLLLYARYDLFRIGNESEGYVISALGSYNGTAGDSFNYHKGMKFTTWDRKNDKIPGSNNNCAAIHHGAWWYKNCQMSNLNGRYRGDDGESTCWNTHNPPKFPWCHGFSSTMIMIRERK